jgi:hypothetical protein
MVPCISFLGASINQANRVDVDMAATLKIPIESSSSPLPRSGI